MPQFGPVYPMHQTWNLVLRCVGSTPFSSMIANNLCYMYGLFPPLKALNEAVFA